MDNFFVEILTVENVGIDKKTKSLEDIHDWVISLN